MNSFNSGIGKKTLAAIIVTVAAVSAIAYVYFRKGGASNRAPQIGTQAVIDVNQERNDLAKFKYKFLVPKSRASEDYYTIFNKTLNEFILLDLTNRNELYPLFTTAKSQISSGDLSGLRASADKIKSLNETEKKREIIISSYLNTFKDVNSLKANTDKETNKLTSNLIATADKLNNDYIAYSKLIDFVLTGAQITSQTIDDVKTTLNNVVSSTIAFEKSSQDLFSFFKQTTDEELKNASSSVKK